MHPTPRPRPVFAAANGLSGEAEPLGALAQVKQLEAVAGAERQARERAEQAAHEAEARRLAAEQLVERIARASWLERRRLLREARS
jgi:hypothetical protein